MALIAANPAENLPETCQAGLHLLLNVISATVKSTDV